MTIVAIKSGAGADIRRLELSDGSLFSFNTCYFPAVFFDDSRYAPGAEISPDEEECFRFASACLRGEKAALRLISRAEQTGAGLTRKLEKSGHSPACVKAVLARLRELDVVDDSRYARLWLQSRLVRKTESPRRLLAALCGRGIPRREAEGALRAVLDSAAEGALLAGFFKKNRLPGDYGPSTVRNILKREGFSPALIRDYGENS
jgi:regulatory protein